MDSSHPSDAQILQALQSSGFLFEQEVATQLEAHDFHVETSWPYLDPDTKKSREIDLRAIKTVLHDEENRIQILVELLVECKDSSSPLVFLERHKNRRELEHSSPKEYVFPRKQYKKQLNEKSYREVPAFIHLSLAESHYYFRDGTKATQFTKVVRKGSNWVANHDGIYDSLFLPMAKVLEARIMSLPKAFRVGEWCQVWLFFPVVVLRDHLASISCEAQDKEINHKGRISFVRNLDSDSLKGNYLVDFVTNEHLGEYLETEIGTFANAVIELSSASPSLLRGESA